MQNSDDAQKRAIIDVISLLKNTFQIKDNDEAVISQQLGSKQQEVEQKLKDLQRKEEEFKKSTLLEMQQIRQYRNEIRRQQLDIKTKFAEINSKLNALQTQEQSIIKQSNDLKQQTIQLNEKDKLIDDQLQRTAEISKDDAIKLLCTRTENDAKARCDKIFKDAINEVNTRLEEEVQNILAFAIQKESTNVASNLATCVIDLPNEALKGKIIGREGRNIRTFEELTGVSVLIDDTPEAIVISCYEPMRREIAKLAMAKLIVDGRIHPQRIEQVVELAKAEINDEVTKTANEILMRFQIQSLHPELVKLLGQLKYRSSYSQNVLEHSCEVATISGYIAAELNINKDIAVRAGLLHDIGKAVDRALTGSHAELGLDIVKRCNESSIICNVVAEHHNDNNVSTIYTWIIKAADTLSSARPGVRQDTFDAYVKRLTDLESTAKSFDNVKSVFAISAGRELRVIVEPERISDTDTDILAENIKQKIEQTLKYPGQIKVTVIREIRCIKTAS
jgi:ribonuclease Y